MLLINMEAGTVIPAIYTPSKYREVTAVDESASYQGRQSAAAILSVVKKQTQSGFSSILEEEEAKF